MTCSFPKDRNYTERLKIKIRETFTLNVRPEAVLIYFQKYDPSVLSTLDIEQVSALTEQKGNQTGSHKLLDCLVIYPGWFDCLQLVLRDRNVKLDHIADFIKEKQEQLNREVKQEKDSHIMKIQVLESEIHEKDRKISALESQIHRLQENLQNRDVQIRQLCSQQDQQSEGVDEHDSGTQDAKTTQNVTNQTSVIERLNRCLDERAEEVARLQSELEQKDELYLDVEKRLQELTAQSETLKTENAKLKEGSTEADCSISEARKRSTSAETVCHPQVKGNPVSQQCLETGAKIRLYQGSICSVDIHVVELELAARGGQDIYSDKCLVHELQCNVRGKIGFREGCLNVFLFFDGHPSSLQLADRSWADIRMKVIVIDVSGQLLQWVLKEDKKPWGQLVEKYKEKTGYSFGGVACEKLMKRGFGKKTERNEKGSLMVSLEIDFL